MTRFLTAPARCLAAAAALSCAIPALAQTPDTVPSVSVKYGDLDIASPPGAQRLLERIEAAAKTVCGGAPDVRQLNQLASFEACRRATVAGRGRSRFADADGDGARRLSGQLRRPLIMPS